jgi:hypothetical protein
MADICPEKHNKNKQLNKIKGKMGCLTQALSLPSLARLSTVEED